jgi:hypothetical protein
MDIEKEKSTRSAEMAFLRSYEGCGELDKLSNHDIMSEFRITNVHRRKVKISQ